MDLSTALTETAPRKGPQSQIDKLLDALDAAGAQDVRNALRDDSLQAAHLGRALTKLAHHHNVIGETSSIDGSAVQSWRAKHTP